MILLCLKWPLKIIFIQWVTSSAVVLSPLCFDYRIWFDYMSNTHYTYVIKHIWNHIKWAKMWKIRGWITPPTNILRLETQLFLFAFLLQYNSIILINIHNKLITHSTYHNKYTSCCCSSSCCCCCDWTISLSIVFFSILPWWSVIIAPFRESFTRT